MIEINDLYKYYDHRRAVGPVSVTIERGQEVGLLGLNGAGKTTTLRILACDLLPTSGSVCVSGMNVVEFPDQVKAKVGYLPDVPPVVTPPPCPAAPCASPPMPPLPGISESPSPPQLQSARQIARARR